MNSRIPSLDGLRALAVLIVFIGHGRTDQGFWPGHLGVTIFFFLSGYLITTLLRREIETTSSIRLGRFYLRRSFRILPAAYFTVFLAIALAGAGILPAQIDGWGVVAELLNVTNYYIIEVGDAGLPPETSQMWTLAVEEQYYLVVPLALLLAYKAGANRHLIGRICIAIALVVPVWRIVLGLNGAVFDRLYSATDTRIDSILWGAALALLLNPVMGDRLRRPNRVTRWVAAHLPLVAGGAAVVVAATSIVPSMAFELSIADTIQGISLIAIFWFLITRPQSAVGRLFNSRVAVRLGVLSFSIYLLHKIVLALVGPTIDFPLLTDSVSLLLSIAAAQLVYWIVERPAVRLRRRIEMALDKRNLTTAHRPHRG
ncbi:acyltransferase family protein [Herbiconiux sp. A18JL235]|uniref:Acyltransferase family protein n=1 Tax=Herbiconiux sp. A18JL235 TaxID=3152363 RepID=A0AB39BLJ5_9MICO